VNSIVFDVLTDTAFLLFDEIPRETKLQNTDLFQYVAGVDVDELPRDMPGVNRRRIASLLAYVPDDTYVNNLVHAWRNASGDIVFGPEVQHSPWEWTESTEPSVSTTTYSREKPELKNSSSIPLEVFGIQPTGERVFGELPNRRDAAAARQLEDGFAADNVFERDWRETRVDWKADLSAAGEFGGEGQHSNASAGDHVKQEPTHAQLSCATASESIGGASPAPTVRSQRSSVGSSRNTQQRASSVLSVSSRGRSSGHGDGEHSLAESNSTHGSKRKASTASIELDPPASATRGGRRGRGRGTNSGRGKGKKK